VTTTASSLALVALAVVPTSTAAVASTVGFTVGATVTSAAAPGEPRTWSFRVLLGDREIGTHVFEVETTGATRQVRSEARFRVSFLFIDAYRYAHTAAERWDGDCLVSIDARTDTNGRRRLVTASPEPCVMSFAYWNPAILTQSRLLNAQTGAIETVRVDSLGTDTIPVRGAPTGALRYALEAGAFRIDVWYAVRPDGTREWVRLETRTKGRTLAYLLD
jgi:hypothetical protein